MKETLIKNFLRISKIPRESGNEEKIADFFVNVAKENQLTYFKDKNNNVLIKKKGNKKSEPIALQAHLDMVCVKTKNSLHDFKNEGIEVIIEEDQVTAKDTSLGADQGVGLAIMLTIMEDSTFNHPDLEFLFTTEEETTFNGAVTFPYEKVSSKRMINLDHSKDDSVFIGADGDTCNEYCLKSEYIEHNLPSYRVRIEGFPEGNSGEEVSLSEKNAITTMAKILKDRDLLIKSIDGGTFENDLASFCEVVISTNLDVKEVFRDVNAKVTKIENTRSFSKEDTKNIINQILDLKCGYITENLASANLGLIHTEGNEVKMYYIFRSMRKEELEKINKESRNLKNNFHVKELYTDPIWEVEEKSELLEKYKSLYFKIHSEYPQEEICHAGMECASIKNRMGELDIISIGSIIKKYHTVEEVTYISSWVKTFDILIQLLEII